MEKKFLQLNHLLIELFSPPIPDATGMSRNVAI